MRTVYIIFGLLALAVGLISISEGGIDQNIAGVLAGTVFIATGFYVLHINRRDKNI